MKFSRKQVADSSHAIWGAPFQFANGWRGVAEIHKMERANGETVYHIALEFAHDGSRRWWTRNGCATLEAAQEQIRNLHI